MEPFVLLPASVYNKNLNTQSAAAQELPKYQALQNTLFQKDSLKEELKKNYFAKTNSQVDKYLCSP